MRDIWDNNNGGGLSPCLNRSFNDWENGGGGGLISDHSISECPGLKDKLIWRKSKAGNYSVKLMYELQDFHSPVPFLVQSIWNPLVPLELGFFAL